MEKFIFTNIINKKGQYLQTDIAPNSFSAHLGGLVWLPVPMNLLANCLITKLQKLFQTTKNKSQLVPTYREFRHPTPTGLASLYYPK